MATKVIRGREIRGSDGREMSTRLSSIRTECLLHGKIGPLKIDRYFVPWWCIGVSPNFLGLFQVIMAKPVIWKWIRKSWWLNLMMIIMIMIYHHHEYIVYCHLPLVFPFKRQLFRGWKHRLGLGGNETGSCDCWWMKFCTTSYVVYLMIYVLYDWNVYMQII